MNYEFAVRRQKELHQEGTYVVVRCAEDDPVNGFHLMPSSKLSTEKEFELRIARDNPPGAKVIPFPTRPGYQPVGPALDISRPPKSGSGVQVATYEPPVLSRLFDKTEELLEAAAHLTGAIGILETYRDNAMVLDAMRDLDHLRRRVQYLAKASRSKS